MTKYIGNIPSQGEFKKLDAIASSFNGSTTQFNLNYNSVSQSVGGAEQLIVSLNGVIQEPLSAYTLGVGGSSIVFASAPASGDTCHIVLFGGVGGTATPSDNSVTAEKIASADDFTFGSITVTGSGSIDGRDISADGTKLDGIEENADVTDTANVTAAGALMDSELTDEASVKALNQGVATTDAVTFAGVSTNEFDLSAIDTNINDTAVDVFVYDTSKDSDGGAWRKRTQHTSWYNETLNTATRGSRKEFPAVAVIVVEDARFTIYDGDDPALPMWMTYTGYFSYFSTNYITSVVAKNGWIFISNNQPNNNHGLTVFSFPNDIYTITDYASSPNFLSEAPVTSRGVRLTRYSSANHVLLQGSPVGIGKPVNDVAMTVLPNAPVDAATGLPVPTIAVATDGGVSVIKDDGTVVGRAQVFSNGGGIYHVDFDGEGYWYGHSYYSETNGSYPGHAGIYSFSDLTSTANLNNNDNRYDSNLIIGTGGSQDNPNWPNSYWSTDVDVWMPNSVDANLGLFNSANGKYFSGRNGISVVEFDGKIYSHITSNYNTGYMVGKNDSVKLATLSDSDDTDITGSNILTGDDSTFTSTQGSWVANQSSASIQSGTLQIVPNSGVNGGAYYALTTTPGTQYILSAEVTQDASSFARLAAGTGNSLTDYASTTNLGVAMNLGVGTHSISFTATGTTTYLWLIVGGGTQQATRFDNIQVSLAEEDRSVNGNGLQVFGTVNKNPVATGADLVAYSGFSTSNYLAQPYNSDIDVGTGDFSFTIWAKADAFNSYNVLFANWWLNQTDAAQFTLETVGSKLWFYVVDGGQFHAAGGNTDLSLGVWNQITVTRKNSLMTVYINGVPESTTYRYTGDLIARTSPLTIGVLWSETGPSGGAVGPWNGSLALFRASATVPSPEQIKKIYEDEKVLFQENAQATLYGSSNAVTALAYDDDTELLHVGTSSGRSVFQGLRRIDNTTDAVGAAISASNGMVAED